MDDAIDGLTAIIDLILTRKGYRARSRPSQPP
jgi:hypothetical protein